MKGTTMRKKLPYLVEYGGRTYVRRYGRKVRILAREGTEDFACEYAAALDGSLALAAALYAEPDLRLLVPHVDGGVSVVDPWPWRWTGPNGSGNNWDKRSKHDRRRRLVIAAALLVAEIERIDRAQS